MKTNLKRLLPILVLVLIFSACSSPKPESTVNTFFTSLVKNDLAAAAACFQQSEDSQQLFTFDDESQEKFITGIFSKIKHEVISSQVSGNKATVKAKVTAPDMTIIVSNMMQELLTAAFSSAMNGEEVNGEAMAEKYITESLSDPNVTLVTNEITINLEKIDNKWVIISDESIINAVTGNMYNAFKDLNN